MLFLNVPYAEKNEAKELGAKWNVEKKKWYVEKREDYDKFMKWIMTDYEEFDIICDYLYIVVGKRNCFKCNKVTNVLAFGYKNMMECFRDDLDEAELDDVDIDISFDGDIHIGGYELGIPNEIIECLKKHFNYKEKYSKTTQMIGLSNCCEHCDSLQGDYFLYEEVDSPFYIDDEEKASNLTLYKLKLPYDFAIEGGFAYGSEDKLIEKYAKIIDVDSLEELDKTLE